MYLVFAGINLFLNHSLMFVAAVPLNKIHFFKKEKHILMHLFFLDSLISVVQFILSKFDT